MILPNPRVPTTTITAPAEILVPSVAPILLIDLTATPKGEGKALISNLGPNSIAICFHNSGTSAPALTTANGVPIPSNGIAIFDDVGGMAIWAICSVLQLVTAGTRISGARV